MNRVTKVFQNSFGEKGTCMTACIASMLSIGFDEVPRFVDITAHLSSDPVARGELWRELVTNFLKERGFTVNYYEDENIEKFHEWSKNLDHEKYYMVLGQSPRSSTRNHIVVYKNGEPYHDPNPDGTFLVNHIQIQELIKIEP